MKKTTFIIFFILCNIVFSQKLLVPMDNEQNDHLKSYGFAFWILKQKDNIDWLLNYKGGAFLINSKAKYLEEARLRGISVYNVSSEELNIIYEIIENNNMSNVLLE